MSTEWPRTPLGEVLVQHSEYIEILEPREYPKLSVKLYGRGVELDTPVDGTSVKMKLHQIAKPGQVIVSEIWAKKGAIGLVPAEGAGALCTSHFFLFDVDENRAHRGWLQALFRANYLGARFDDEAKGTTTYAAIRPKHFLAAEIPLPPLADQQRIVAKIERIAAKFDEARGLQDRSTTAVGTFDSFSAAAIARSVPTTYWRPLGEIVEVGGGGTPAKDNPAFWGGDVPWISPKDMKHRRIHTSTDFITRVALDNSAARLHAPGCVLVVIRGMILAHTVPVAVLDVNAAINQDMKALRPNTRIESDYLCSILWALNGEMLGLIDRSSHDTRKFNTAKLLGFRIPVPPPKEQRRIVAYLDGLQAKVDRLKGLQAQTRAELDALLPSILDRAFKGEL